MSTCTCDLTRKPEPTFAGCLQHDPTTRTEREIEDDLAALRAQRAARFARVAGIYGANLDDDHRRGA